MNDHPDHRSRGQDVWLILGGALLFLAPAMINGFPFVYPDTGTYLRSAFQGYVPVDRPYWYGVFLRVASLGGHSFWSMVAAQALLASTYAVRTLRLFVPPERGPWRVLLVLVVLAGCSSVGWYAGQLMPDIFTGIGLLAVLLLLWPGAAVWSRILDGLVVVLCCWLHLSNLLILPIAGALFLLLTARRSKPRWIGLASLSVVAWAGSAIANYAVDGRFYLSRSGHVFLTGRLLDTGILQDWLNEHCTDGHGGLCRYRDHLPPNGDAFLWADDSPLYREGGWLATQADYDSIIRSALTEPTYAVRFLGAGLVSTADLLSQRGVCIGLTNTDYRDPKSPPYVMIAGTIPSGLAAYRGSLQNGGRGELDMRIPDLLCTALLWCSALVAVVLIVRGGRTASGLDVRLLLAYALGAVVIACAVCAALNTVENRYLGRVSWIVPLMVLAVVPRRE